MAGPALVRIPDQHELPTPEHPDDQTRVARAVTASFNDAHRLLAVLDQLLPPDASPASP